MVLRTTSKYDFSNIVDPTIELWLAEHSYGQQNENVNEGAANFWFTTKDIDLPFKSDLPLTESLSSVEVGTPTSMIDLDSPSQPAHSSEESGAKLDYAHQITAREFWNYQKSLPENGIEYLPVVVTNGLSDFILTMFHEFWNTQSTFTCPGLQDSSLAAASRFLKVQERILYTGLSNISVTFFKEFWDSEKANSFHGIDDFSVAFMGDFFELQKPTNLEGISELALEYYKDFRETTFSQLEAGISDVRLLGDEAFFQKEDNLSGNGLCESLLTSAADSWIPCAETTTIIKNTNDKLVLCFRDFWKLQNLSLSQGTDDCILSATREFMEFSLNHNSPDAVGNSDLTYFAEFWKSQRCRIQEGLDDNALLASKEFWENKENTFETKISAELNACLDLCDGYKPKLGGDLVSSLQSLRTNILVSLQKKDLNLEMANKFTSEEHFKEVNELRKVIQNLREEKSQWNRSQELMAKELSQKDKQLEVVDEMISHNVDLEFVNDELNRRWTKATVKLAAVNDITKENHRLLSVNSNLMSEKQDLITRFTKRQEELITSNANLNTIVLSMEKAADRNFEQCRQLERTIEALKKNDRDNCTQRFNSDSTDGVVLRYASDSESTGSKSLRRRRSFSRKRGNNSLRKIHDEATLVPPPSAGMIYVSS